MLEKVTRTVYKATTKGRCYLTKAAAIRAEARALIENRHPSERAYMERGYVVDPGWHWTALPRHEVLYRRVCRLVKRSFDATHPKD